MHLGERFCVAGKRARKFKRSDPKTYVPSWCPRLKAPCELRIYGFKNQREWRMHRSMRAYLGEDTSPSAFRYAVRYEGHTDLAPYEFFECCNVKSDDEILGAAVQHYDVVEIDDGIKPAFFYKTEHGYELLFSFDAKTAKKRWKEYSAQQMTELAEVLEGIEDFSIEGQEPVVLKWVEDKGYKLGDVMNAFRLTLVGEGKGPGMFDISAFLGKEETLRRLRKAIEVLG